MKVLKIKNNHGMYIIDGKENPIIDINKDDIMTLLDVIYSNNDIEIEKIDEKHLILNEAERVIYENFCKYLNEFIKKKDDLKSEIDNEFSELAKLIEGESVKE